MTTAESLARPNGNLGSHKLAKMGAKSGHIYLCEIQGYNLNHCVQLSSLSVETKSLYNISNFLFRRPPNYQITNTKKCATIFNKVSSLCVLEENANFAFS